MVGVTSVRRRPLLFLIRCTNICRLNFFMPAPQILRCFDFGLEGAGQERMGLRRPKPSMATRPRPRPPSLAAGKKLDYCLIFLTLMK